MRCRIGLLATGLRCVSGVVGAKVSPIRPLRSRYRHALGDALGAAHRPSAVMAAEGLHWPCIAHAGRALPVWSSRPKTKNRTTANAALAGRSALPPALQCPQSAPPGRSPCASRSGVGRRLRGWREW